MAGLVSLHKGNGHILAGATVKHDRVYSNSPVGVTVKHDRGYSNSPVGVTMKHDKV